MYNQTHFKTFIKIWASTIFVFLSVTFSQTDAIPADAVPITTLPYSPSVNLPPDSFTLLSESGRKTCEQAAFMFLPSEGYIVESVDCVFYPVRTGLEILWIQNGIRDLGYELYIDESDEERIWKVYLNSENYNYMIVTIPDPQPNDGLDITMLLVYKNFTPAR